MARPNLSPSHPASSVHALSSPSRSDQQTRLALYRSSRRSPRLISSLATPTPTSYEHLSAVRSTHEAAQDDMFQPACDPAEDCSFAPEGDFDCEECAQVCEGTACTVELTSQCTDQCVVVVCNDAHHDAPSCVECPSTDQCGKECAGEFDCTIFDQFLQCCMDHQLDQHPDYRSYAAGIGDYAFLTDPAMNSYLTAGGPSAQSQQQMQDPLALPQMDSATSTPQLVPSPAPSFPQSGQSMPSPTLPSPSLPAVSAPLQCKWSGCYATFSTLSELVGHVNLQHLRMPGPSAAFSGDNQSFSAPHHQPVYPPQQGADGTLACLWGDCQLYPSSQPMPGPSSGDAFEWLDVLSHHLLQDHLGLSTRNHAHDTFAPHSCQSTPQPLPADAVASGGLPSPVPEHDCSSPSSHVCRWTGCGESFASCNALTEHLASAHIGGGRAHYDCFWEGCTRNGDSGFASKQKISRHLQSHTGHRPFQCEVCGQHFSEAATLAQHMRRHTQEKPYVCDFPGCGKAFAIAGALTIHKRTHNGSKPFKCTYCDRAFSESSNLSKHLRTHTGARPYPCTDPGCNKSFARPDQLARHMNVHKRKAAEHAQSQAVMAVAS
ncbi:hypothetical protein C8Q80DRAFT_1194386 [Daedaleopsis nitida]|nr:hypothetical protein C8Q80DRAFT_1194386 [Daedaleopsis nitida]